MLLGGPGNASAVIESGSEAARAGNVQAIVFKFSKAGEVPLSAFVVPATSYFTGFGPSTLPETPETKPTGSATATTTSGSEGGTPSESESDEVTPTDSASASTQAR